MRVVDRGNEDQLHLVIREDRSEVVDDFDAGEALSRGGEGVGRFTFQNRVEREELRQGEDKGGVEDEGGHSHPEYGAFNRSHFKVEENKKRKCVFSLRLAPR